LDQLFVCYGQRVLEKSLSKQRLLHWIVDTIASEYQLVGRPLPCAVVAHYTRGEATLWALLRGVPLDEIYTSGSWASLSTFALLTLSSQCCCRQPGRDGRVGCCLHFPGRGWKDKHDCPLLIWPCLDHRLIWYCDTILE
jgi:hypothetical protein